MEPNKYSLLSPPIYFLYLELEILSFVYLVNLKEGNLFISRNAFKKLIYQCYKILEFSNSLCFRKNKTVA